MTPGEPLVRWDWVISNLPDIQTRLVEHLLLAGLAVLVGCAIAGPLGVAAWRWRRLEAPIVWSTGILYTIPSLALFALLVPVTGLTVLTAQIGLVSYTLLILVRNVLGGLRSVPWEVRESAIGLGYAPRDLLWRIDLPLALPVIMAGVRVAAITTIGLTTVTALIGQGGLGYFILVGIQRFFSTPLLVGASLSIALAIAVDALLVLLQRRLTPWERTH